MDWQAAGDWQGGTPGQPADLPALLAAFEHGGAWERAAPCAALAVALETAAGAGGLSAAGPGGVTAGGPGGRYAGPGGLYAVAGADALIGIVRQWAAVEAWAAAGMLGALRAMMRDDDAGAPVLRRRTDLPGGWDDSLTYEIAAALAMGPQSAGNLANLAWTLGMRLPGIGRLLAGGILTRSKARLVAQVFEPLDEDEAARAEALIAGELAGKSYPQVERLAWRAALAVAPDVAERRRSRAERCARVTVFREQAGTVGLSGRDLPAAEALAGHANVAARAAVYAASGAFPGQDASRLQAQAYLDLLGQIPAADRIAFAAAAGSEPPGEAAPHGAGRGSPQPPGGPGPDTAGDDGDEDWFGGDDGPGPGRGDGGGDGDGPGDSGGGSPAPLAGTGTSTSDVSGSPDTGGDDDDHPADDPDDDIPDPGDDYDDPADDSGDDIPGPGGDDDDHILEPGGDDDDHPADDPDDDIPGPADDSDDDIPDLGGDGGGLGGQEAPGPPSPPLAEVTVPLATLQGKAERAGDNRLLGPLDPALARQLAAAAANSPHSRWEITIVDEHGYATGHSIARPARGRPGRPQPPGPGPRRALGTLPARVTITVTEALLRELAAQAAQPPQRRSSAVASKPRSGAPPGDWELMPRKPRTWILTLPGGRHLTVRFDLVPTHACDHRYQTSAYQPGDRLRRLIQVRDHQCTFPTCSRAARESDFEHAIPYDKGGTTDACNAGARSRRCHQVKQTAGWTVTQPKPGWHQWTTPTGRTYTQEPWRYTA